MESERARLALVNNAAIAADDIQTVRPAGVCLFGGILNAVKQSRHFQVQVSDAGAGDGAALLVGSGAAEEDVLPDIGLHLPEIGGVRLLDVHDIKSGAILVLLVKLVERGSLPAEWRSSVAAENKHDRLRAPE